LRINKQAFPPVRVDALIPTSTYFRHSVTPYRTASGEKETTGYEPFDLDVLHNESLHGWSRPRASTSLQPATARASADTARVGVKRRNTHVSAWALKKEKHARERSRTRTSVTPIRGATWHTTSTRCWQVYRNIVRVISRYKYRNNEHPGSISFDQTHHTHGMGIPWSRASSPWRRASCFKQKCLDEAFLKTMP